MFALVLLLANRGALNGLLRWIGLTGGPVALLYNNGTNFGTFTIGSNFTYPASNGTFAFGSNQTGFTVTGTASQTQNGNGGLSYSFDYANVRFILADQFVDNDLGGSTTSAPAQLPWIMSRVSDPSRPLQAFFFSHKNLLGGNHKDNLFGANVAPITSAAIALTLNGAAFLGEIWRGCIQAIPTGQWEAATALGMRHLPRMRYVILPQAGKLAIAPTVGFLVLLLKSTSLASIIGFVEVTRAGQIINNVTFRPFLVFGIVAAIYFVLCWPLSLLSQRLEQRFGTVSR